MNVGYCELLAEGDVHDPEGLARYIQQITGTPWPTLEDMILLKKKCKEFFELYPHVDYVTLCHVANWAKRKKKRFSNVWKCVDAYRWAWEDGAIPEIANNCDRQTERLIGDALSVETDELWRNALISTEDGNVRKDLVERWLIRRKPVVMR